MHKGGRCGFSINGISIEGGTREAWQDFVNTRRDRWGNYNW
jgi:hypothetical protein